MRELGESYRKPTRGFARYIQIAQGSLEENKYYIILSNDLKYLNRSDYHHLYYMADETSRILTGLRKKILQRVYS